MADLAALHSKLDALLLTSVANQSKIDSIPTILANQDALDKKIEAVIEKVTAIEARTSSLEGAMTDVYAEINQMKSSIQHMAIDMNKIQQTNLKNHFVIQNLPPDLHKNSALKVMQALAARMDIHLESGDFQTQPYVRQQRNKKSSHILGAFYDVRKKQQLFNKYKVSRPIPVEDICENLQADSIFRGKEISLNNLLTKTNSSLLYHARQEKELFEFRWENEGRVLLKQRQGAPTIEVTSLGHLQQIIGRFRHTTGEPFNSQNLMETNQT